MTGDGARSKVSRTDPATLNGQGAVRTRTVAAPDRRRRWYPELDAAGFTRVDGTVAFYVRVRALIGSRPEKATVLDYGAGRGRYLEDTVEFRRRLRDLRDVAHVIGVDVDEAVLMNGAVDESRVIDGTGRVPLPDASVDVVVSDFTFEHLSEPKVVCDELGRVMRPGGWLCVRTPNRLGFVALCARLVPNGLHSAALRRLQPSKAERDTFPTRYRINTVREFERQFPAPDYRVAGYAVDAEPAYAGSSRVLMSLTRALSRLTPEKYRSVLHVYVQKQGRGSDDEPDGSSSTVGVDSIP